MFMGKGKRVILFLSLMLLLVPVAPSVIGQGFEEVVVLFTDAREDDVGSGGLLYPKHGLYVPGLFDLLRFEVARDNDFTYFDFQFAALTNPFQAPEGYFHQRLEVYMRTGESEGRRDVRVGPYTLQTAPDLGWDFRLSVAPFDESRLYVVGEDGQIGVFSGEVHSRRLPESETIRAQVKSSILPQPDSDWGYYVLVGAFDGLAEGFWRDLGEGPWQVGGTGTPIFDILAPRFGRHSQKAQLSAGVLYPVVASRFPVVPWLFGILATVLVLTVFFLWRWRHGGS
ncbi:MAG: hypothetical protein M0R49_10420 [Limnochordia bacterium]|nr:hypothetical protein [Limnochordia bacterium]